MSLDDFSLELKDEEQKLMYQFMLDAKKNISKYAGRKLYSELKDNILKNHELLAVKGKNEFTEENCKNWFAEKGTKENYRDVSFEVDINGKQYMFGLGIKNIAFGEGDYNDFGKNIIGSRDDNIVEIIKKINTKTT